MHSPSLTRLLADAYREDARRAAQSLTSPTPRQHDVRTARTSSIRALVARFAH
jgi:hypothetical protein